MATPLTDSIDALTAYANEVTGASDTNLSDAVHTLAKGYSHMISGSFTPESSSTVYTLDTQSTNWTKLFIVPRVYPYEIAGARCIGVKYVNLSSMRMDSAYGGSSNSATTTAQGSSHVVNSDDNDNVTVQNGVVTFGGAQASVGRFIAGCVYDWYAW